MCHHYQAERRRQLLEKRFGLVLPLDWEPPPRGLHIYPTQFAPNIRRPPERGSGDEAALNSKWWKPASACCRILQRT